MRSNALADIGKGVIKKSLLENRKDLHDNYVHMISGSASARLYLEGSVNVPSPFGSEYVPETYMYWPSRTMKSLQYFFAYSVSILK